MTPKEKAQSLLDKHRTFIRTADKYCQLNVDDEIYLSKQSALITVNEILNVLSKTENIQQHPIGVWKAQEYWAEVKNELEKL